jgi:hypothetical protein
MMAGGSEQSEKAMVRPGHAEEHPTEEEIDNTLEQSFPASDPPGWTLGIERPNARPEADTSVDPTRGDDSA